MRAGNAASWRLCSSCAAPTGSAAQRRARHGLDSQLASASLPPADAQSAGGHREIRRFVPARALGSERISGAHRVFLAHNVGSCIEAAQSHSTPFAPGTCRAHDANCRGKRWVAKRRERANIAAGAAARLALSANGEASGRDHERDRNSALEASGSRLSLSSSTASVAVRCTDRGGTRPLVLPPHQLLTVLY